MMVSALNFAFFYLCAFPSLRLSIFELSSDERSISNKQREDTIPRARKKKREIFKKNIKN